MVAIWVAVMRDDVAMIVSIISLNALLGIRDSLGFTHIPRKSDLLGGLFLGKAIVHNVLTILNVIDHPSELVGLGKVGVRVCIVVFHV